MKKIIYNKVQDFYVTRNVPNDFTVGKLVTIQKKSNATECGNYKVLSLISHVLKILLNIVKNMIKNKVGHKIEDDQFGFKL